jgi:carboxymethylenebutenolidase
MRAFPRGCGAKGKDNPLLNPAGESIMTRQMFDGRRFLVQMLLAVNLVIWGTCLARADEKSKAAEPKPAEYVRDTFESGGQTIRVWRFDPKAEGKQPAVLLLYGVDGLQVAPDTYCTVAKQLAGEGYVVFLVHYLDSTQTRRNNEQPLSGLVQRGLRRKTTAAEDREIRELFQVWIACVRDAAAHARKQPQVDRERIGIVGVSLGGFVGLACAAEGEVKARAVVSCCGGLPREMHETVQKLPPTLAFYGGQDQIVPVAEGRALEKLARNRKLPVEVRVYDRVGHLFQKEEGKFDLIALFDAQRRMTEHLQKHLKAAGPERSSK